ncbi:hypothetical protein K461DRAFT_233625 [Myriangium duriaei CBS 260.36]|uniref:Rhodopsin domain-containing protein n=1 Tax=Myriangium duriaei CBS 260.36 TaxID=1168546 RepID=A0A9P4MCF8_9PEZI|nr:hypothetical protein K461DRAFT_233625 [Myriangium duriaei CBS 260.36]
MSSAIQPPLSSYSPEYLSEYSGDILRDVAIAFSVLEIGFVSLRFTAKAAGNNPFGVDDLLVVAALVACLGLNATCLFVIHAGGVGWHLVVVELTMPEKLVPWRKGLFINPILYIAAILFGKLAILIFYSRIFVTRSQRIATYSLIAITIAIGIANSIASVLECIPLQHLWDRNIEGSCFDIPAFYRYSTMPNVITDVAMLLLPIPTVWNLHTSLRVKLGLTVTFLAGSIGLIASIVRTVAFFRHDPLEDGTWASVVFLTWAVIESGCYLIASCSLCFRPLLNMLASFNFCRGSEASTPSRTWKTFFSSSNRSSASGRHNSILLIRRDTHIVVTAGANTQQGPQSSEEALV